MRTPKVSDIIGILNKIAPPGLAEDWDNPGLQVGDPTSEVRRIAVALDATVPVIRDARLRKADLLLTHHPLIFRPLKRIDTTDPTGAILAEALSSSIAVVSLHTNYDSARGGLNNLLAERLGLSDAVPLKGNPESLVKLAVFVPRGHEEQVMEALFVFSGFIGRYRDCSFRGDGKGTFTPLEGAKPFIGKSGRREEVEEVRLEVLVRKDDLNRALRAMAKVHPYEEPACDIYPVLNPGPEAGLGRIGKLSTETTLAAFAADVKERLGLPAIRYVGAGGRTVRKIAVCGGSGSSLLKDAIRKGADVLVTGDVKYHEARDAEALGLALVDAGHFGTESIMIEGLASRLGEALAVAGFEAEAVPLDIEKDAFVFA